MLFFFLSKSLFGLTWRVGEKEKSHIRNWDYLDWIYFFSKILLGLTHEEKERKKNKRKWKIKLFKLYKSKKIYIYVKSVDNLFEII